MLISSIRRISNTLFRSEKESNFNNLQKIFLLFKQEKRLIHKLRLRRLIERKKLGKMTSSCSYFYDDEGQIQSYDPEIAHGESIVDRKSVFQGHCASVQRVEHVEIFLTKLKENKKIENAFHNMWAYRIDKTDPYARVGSKSASIIQDCDDDGEQAAGGRLLSLLQILNVVNVVVVVSRWYGGIQLGPARFKHINNSARDSLVKGGFVNDGNKTGADQEQQAGSSKVKNNNSKKKKKN